MRHETVAAGAHDERPIDELVRLDSMFRSLPPPTLHCRVLAELRHAPGRHSALVYVGEQEAFGECLGRQVNSSLIGASLRDRLEH
jgi:hypothetical protein